MSNAKNSKVLPHHTAVCVVDFDKAKQFYCDFLGFELEGEMDQRSEEALDKVVGLQDAMIRWAMLVKEGYRVELFKYYSPAGNPQAGRQCDVSFSHMAFEVDDVDAIYRKATAAGYKCLSEPQLLRGGATKVFYVLEPEGLATEFIEFPKPNPSSILQEQQFISEG